MPISGVPQFWARVNKTETCWLWTGATLPFGHGHLGRRVDGVNVDHLAHRFAWEATYGPIPSDACVLHRCDVPACVRPDHLFIGSKADNNQDRTSKGRGHIGERHPSAKLTADKVRQLRELYAKGLTQRALADRFGVSQIVVSRIVRRVAWKQVR
jgi:hypothetical protein